MNLKDNGLVNLLIYILAPIFQLSSAFLAEFIISHELMSCTRVRKVFETICKHQKERKENNQLIVSCFAI